MHVQSGTLCTEPGCTRAGERLPHGQARAPGEGAPRWVFSDVHARVTATGAKRGTRPALCHSFVPADFCCLFLHWASHGRSCSCLPSPAFPGVRGRPWARPPPPQRPLSVRPFVSITLALPGLPFPLLVSIFSPDTSFVGKFLVPEQRGPLSLVISKLFLNSMGLSCDTALVALTEDCPALSPGLPVQPPGLSISESLAHVSPHANKRCSCHPENTKGFRGPVSETGVRDQLLE